MTNPFIGHLIMAHKKKEPMKKEKRAKEDKKEMMHKEEKKMMKGCKK